MTAALRIEELPSGLDWEAFMSRVADCGKQTMTALAAATTGG